MISLRLAALLLTMILVSCNEPVGEPPEDLYGRWQLVSFESNGDIPDQTPAGSWIEFAPDGQASGVGACNDYGATYTYGEGRLVLEEGFVTGSECIGATGGFEHTIIAISGSQIRVGIDATGRMVWQTRDARLAFSPTH